MANLRTNNLSGEQGQNAYRGSVFFDESSSFLSLNAAIWNSQASDSCTFECWLWVADFSTARNIFDLGSTGDFSIQSDGQIRVHPVASNHMDTNNSITTQSWHHIALVQESGRKDVYINGVKSSMTVGGGDPVASNWANTNANTFNLGDDGVYRDFYRGYMSNVRVIKGVALYDDDFTPPFTELKATDPNTSLLCCQNSDDVTQEETGKTITGNGSLATAGYNKTQPKVIPPYGVDAGNTFGGPIQQSSQGYMYFPTGRTEERGRGRGIISGGGSPASPYYINTIEFISIQSMGNGQDFGDLSSAAKGAGSTLGNETRAVAGGGYGTPINIGSMEFFEIATQSNTTDFGDLVNQIRNLTSLANSTRGIFAGGTYAPGSPGTHFNTIQFITIGTLGDATDFGDMVSGRRDSAALSSPTRGIIAGGNPGSGPQVTDEIDYITIASAGNAQDFGNITNSEREIGGAASSTRGIIFGGYSSPAFRNTIDFITIATTGNASDFGDLTAARTSTDGCSNKTRAAMCSGSTPTYVNLIDFVTLATTGDAADFGDLTEGKLSMSGCTSDSHGGLS